MNQPIIHELDTLAVNACKALGSVPLAPS